MSRLQRSFISRSGYLNRWLRNYYIARLRRSQDYSHITRCRSDNRRRSKESVYFFEYLPRRGFMFRAHMFILVVKKSSTR
jgi:hypothetical protein